MTIKIYVAIVDNLLYTLSIETNERHKIMKRSITTIKSYVLSHNLQAEFYTVANENCWMSKMKNADAWFDENGFITLDQLVNYLDECARPTAADLYYIEMQNMQAEFEKQEKENRRREKIEMNRLYGEYCSKKKPLTHNPFYILKESLYE